MNAKNHPGPKQTLDDILNFKSEADTLRVSNDSRQKKLEIIAKVSKSVSETLDLNRLLKRITSLVHKEFGYPFVHIYLVHYVPQTVEFAFGSGSRAKFYNEVKVSFDIHSPIGLIPLAVRTGKTQLSNKVSTDPQYLLYRPEESLTSSELVVPLIYGNQILGVLDVQSDKENAFGPEDVEVLETLSAYIAIAINNANMYRSEVWRRQGAESLRDIALLLATNVGLKELFQTVFKKMMALLPSKIASIWIFDTLEEDQKPTQFRLVSSRTQPNTIKKPKNYTVNIDDVWFSKAIHGDQVIIRLSGDKTDPFYQHGYLDEEFSAIAAPLSTGGKQLGVLILHENSFGRYGNEARNIAASFSGYTAVALENARLSAQSIDQAWVATILLQVALATQTLTTIPELIETIGQLTIALVGGRMGALLLPCTDTQYLSVAAVYGKTSPKKDDDPINSIFHDDLLWNTCQKPLERAIPAPAFSSKFKKAFKLRDNETVYLFPLVVHNQTLGILMHISKSDAEQSEPIHLLGKQRFTILQGIAQQTAINLQNINLVNERQEESYISNVLLQTSNYLVTSGSLLCALDRLCQSLTCFVGAEDILILQRKDDGTHIVRTYVSSHRDYDDKAIHLGKEFPGIIFDSLSDNDPSNTHYIKPYAWYQQLDPINSSATPSKFNEIHTVITPLTMPGENYGLLIINLRQLEEKDKRLKLIQEIARQIASAIQNNQVQHFQNIQALLEREFQLARQIQKTFLPEKLPVIPGYELAVKWQTARDVGGDFYDAFEVKPGYTGLVIADVSDKGLPASLYMTVSRTLIRAIALEDISPAQTLERVNHLLQLDSSQGFFVTVFYGIVHHETGIMEYCIAGHNPPYYLNHAQKEVSALPRGGIALGAMPDIHLKNQSIQLQQGDACVLYTDGITETFNSNGIPFGNLRFERSLAKTIDISAQELLDIIEQDVKTFRATAPTSDDTTILVIKRTLD